MKPLDTQHADCSPPCRHVPRWMRAEAKAFELRRRAEKAEAEAAELRAKLARIGAREVES